MKGNFMDIQPLEDRVVIKPFTEERAPGAIIIPDDAKEKSMEGTVVAVGPGLVDQSMMIPVDSKVLYSRFVGVEVDYGGEEYLIMRAPEVLAILKKAE